MAKKEENKTARLRRLEEKHSLVIKSRDYLESELSRVRLREASIRKDIGKEKKAISLVNKAKRLR